MPIAERIQTGFSEQNLSFIIRTGTGILGVLLVSIIISRIIYPFDLGHQEAFSWMPAAHLLEGKNPYSFAFTPPYSMVPYGVVYYALLAVGIKFFGFNLWWGRFLSVLAFAVCVWSVVKITSKLTGNKNAAWVAGLASLALFPAQMWVGVMRSDLIALAFAITALDLVFTSEKDIQIGSRRLIIVILLCAAVFFTKHTFLLPVGIIVLRFLQLNKWREAVLFSTAFLVLVSAGMFFLNYTSAGGYLWQHFTHAQQLPFSLEKLFEGVFRILTMPATIVFGIALLLFAYRRRQIFFGKNRDELINLLKSPKLLILFYLFLSFTAASVSMGRVGANLYYYLESSFVAAIVVGFIYEDFKRKSSPKLALAMIILFMLGGTFQLARVARGEYFRWQAQSYYHEISETAAKFTPPGSVCFSIYVELVARNGCAFHFDDYGEYTTGWTPELHALFENEVKAGQYAVVVWDKDDFEEKFSNYQLILMSQNVPERFSPVYLYVRKTKTAQ